MKKFWLRFTVIALAGFIPLSVLTCVGFGQDKKYESTFYGGLLVKDSRLENVANKKKIVFLGGSSLSFGLRSPMMSEALGYEVVDYGLYAPLGIRTMAELAKKKIEKGDVVIFAPEINEETYQTKINYNMLLKCAEANTSILHRFGIEEQAEIAANWPYFVIERAAANVQATAPYDRASFDSYGDIRNSLVTLNILPEFYDSSQKIAPDPSLLTKDFVNYVNDYKKAMDKIGASTYFTFSPTNVLGLVEDNLPAFETKLKESLACKVLGSVKEFAYHQNYFYDTNFHLNYAGTIVHSEKLTNVLKTELGIESTYEFPEVEMPRAQYEKAPDPEPEPTPEPEPEKPFTVEKSGQDYFLTKVGDSLKKKDIVRVPDEVDGHPITGISSGAFKDFANLKYVILPSMVDTLTNDIFEGCSNLERIYLTNERAPMLVGTGFLNGCKETVRIYILRSASTTYTTGYTWVSYKTKFKLYNIEDLPSES